jgi:hypothetical protein
MERSWIAARSAYLDREVRASRVAVLRASWKIERLFRAFVNTSKCVKTIEGSQVAVYLGTAGFSLKTPLIRLITRAFLPTSTFFDDLEWKKALNGQYLPSCNSCRNENNPRGNLGPP